MSEPFSNPFSSSEPAATGSLGEDGEAIATTAPAIRTPRIRSEALAAPGPSMSPRTVPSAPPIAASVSGGNPSGMNPSGLNPDAGRPRAPQAKTSVAAPIAKTATAPAMTPRAVAPEAKLKFVPGAKPAEKPAKVAEAKPAAKAPETKPVAKAPEPKHEAKVEPRHEPKIDAKKAEAARKAEAEAKAARADAAKDVARKVAEAKAAEAAAKAAAKEAKQTAKETPAPAAAPVKVASAEPAAIPAASSASDAFRWPAKGRIINGYGSSGNEGINIAVPEGTPVKAAEEGTVAYAGSDVKGYGKLVLVRHNNGYVSAYAHNGEIDVRPGEKVKRGQVIAKSGATGNVTSPQLHFEIRKGATPVDPMPHLGG